MYEPAPIDHDNLQSGDPDEYRRRIEALKREMGDGWLKVLASQRSP